MMTTKSPAIASTFLASLLMAGSTANAANLGLPGPAFEREHPNGLLHRVHDAGQVVYELRAKGYHQIQVVDPYLPKIQVNACKDGTRWHLHANYYGDITHREWMGPCYRTRYGTRYGSQYRPWQERYGDY
jgi:hypothetical protein